MDTVDHTTLHRTAKYFMDAGRVATHQEAMALLGTFGLAIRITPAAAARIDSQIALLTLVNLARRTFLAGVEVSGIQDEPLLTRIGDGATLAEAVAGLGGIVANTARSDWPIAMIGEEVTADQAGWRLVWDGWRGGVVPLGEASVRCGADALPLAPAMAAAACVAEVFAFLAGDHPMAGKRSAGLSLWQPGHDWLQADATEPTLAYLPSRLWLIGLGNLGQAYAWLLACLPYKRETGVELVLQDFDRIAVSNDSTSLLANKDVVGRLKTRWVAEWLERRGFTTQIVERRFGEWTKRWSEEPGVALCGTDNALARSALEAAGIDLVIESGLGGGAQSFRSFSMHSFPGSRKAEHIWSAAAPGTTEADVSANPAYADLKAKGVDQCGLAQLASRTVGVPFVGLVAAGLVVSELLRRLHGGAPQELVSGSLLNLEDIESHSGTGNVYAHGHLPVA